MSKKSSFPVACLLSLTLGTLGAGCGAPVPDGSIDKLGGQGSGQGSGQGGQGSGQGDALCSSLPDVTAKVGSCAGFALPPFFSKQSCEATLMACPNGAAHQSVADAVKCFGELPACDPLSLASFTTSYVQCTTRLASALTGCAGVTTPPTMPPTPAGLPSVAQILIGGGVDAAHVFLSVPSDGSKVDLYNSNDGSGRQVWRVTPSADGKSYNIAISGGVDGGLKYLSTIPEGTWVNLWTQDDGSGRQRWNIVPSGDGKTYHIQVAGGVAPGHQYLSTIPDGSLVGLVDRDDASGRQRWKLEAVK